MVTLKLTGKNTAAVIREAAAALRAGKLVVYPTDTSYALGALATSAKAVNKIYKVKGRNAKKPLHVTVSSVAQAKQYVAWNRYAGAIAKALLPGRVTLVLPLGRGAKKLAPLTAGTGILGVRIPDSSFCAALVRAAGGPITATSANISGKADAYSADAVAKQFARRKHQPDLIVDAGELRATLPSTVISIVERGTGETDVAMLRLGSVAWAKVMRALKGF